MDISQVQDFKLQIYQLVHMTAHYAYLWFYLTISIKYHKIQMYMNISLLSMLGILKYKKNSKQPN